MDLGLKGKVAVITGGSSGIGKSAAQFMAAEGAKVVILARRQDVLDEARKELEQYGTVESRVCDVSDLDGYAALIKELAESYGALDVLVNNAGVGVGGMVPDITDEQWRYGFRMQVDAPFAAMRVALPIMYAQRSGAIVNVSAITAARASAGLAGHGVPRAALQQLSNFAAIEGAPHGVRVNAIQVGAVTTPSNQQWMAEYPGLEEKVAAAIPLQRIAKADEIGALIAYLASPRASFITGSTVVIDGGSSAAFVGS